MSNKSPFLRMVVAAALVLAVASGAGAVEVFDDFDKGINEDVWRVYTGFKNGSIEVVDGALWIFDMEPGSGGQWSQKGIMLRSPLDLAGKKTTISVKYDEILYNNQNVGFWSDGTIEKIDTWSVHPGFRLTVTNTSVGPTFTRQSNGTFSNTATVPIPYPPFTLTWVITHVEGTTYKSEVFFDDSLVHESNMNLGSMPANPVYFYYYVSNRDQFGPTVVDYIRIEQQEAR